MNKSRLPAQLSLFDHPPSPRYPVGQETRVRLRTLLGELLRQVAAFEAQERLPPSAQHDEERGDE
ncbi:hypothetical protein [uncultured Thiodictyon sp.]|uniref:hypothetical protein n=1 Tax=uncultured Thiodictyon sp. TaxID=1846217 RepID=UPI0025E915F6|nr:hypothetical protein [uncultured Thiodictyon sp.]